MCGGSTNALRFLHCVFSAWAHKAHRHSIYATRVEIIPFYLFSFSLAMLSNRTGKQFSLDSRMDLVFHGLEGGRSEPGNKNHAITEDGEESWEGTKGRYCAMIIYRKHLDVVRDSL